MTTSEKNLNGLLQTLRQQGILVRIKDHESEASRKVDLRDRDGREISLHVDLDQILGDAIQLVPPSIKDEIPEWLARKFEEVGIKCTTFGRSSIQFYNLEGLAMEPMRVM